MGSEDIESSHTRDFLTAEGVHRYDEDKKRLYAGGGIACCVCFCVVFLLLFFFIPRAPYARYNSSTAYFVPQYTVYQSYTVYNRNMYSLSLYDFAMQLTTTTGSGAKLVGYGTLDNDGDTSFTVPRNSQKDLTLVYVFNSTSAERISANSQCFSSSGVSYTTTGSVGMKTWVTNFNNVNLGPWTITYFCSSS